MYQKPLKVSTAEGKRIYAKVYVQGDDRVIRVPFIKEVEKDNPPFSKKGVITITVSTNTYHDAIEKLESYLENLFLKGMADEDSRTSHEARAKSGGAEKVHTEGKTGTDKGPGKTSSVRDSSRGNESAESSGGRESSKTELAKKDDSENS